MLQLPELQQPYKLYVRVQGRSALVVLGRGLFGYYIKTEADGVDVNNLLALPNLD